MRKNIQIPHPSRLLDGVILRPDRRREVLERQTNQHVQRLLRDARREANDLQQQAYQAGYQQGMLLALEQLTAWLNACDEKAALLQERIAAQAQAMLSSAVNSPDTLLVLLNEGLQNLPASDETLHLLLPANARSLRPQIMSVLDKQWRGPVQLDFHPGPGFVLRYKDQIVEFAPEHYLEQATLTLRQTISELPAECRQLSSAAFSALMAQWQPQAASLNDQPD